MNTKLMHHNILNMFLIDLLKMLGIDPVYKS